MKKLLMSCVALASCADDDAARIDDPQPTSRAFTVRIENVAPWRVLKSGTQAMKANGTTGPLGPGEIYSVTFTAGKGHAISFATMLGESNDWFFGPGPEGLMLYDARGEPISGDVTRYIKLWNAGTEIDQEPAVGDATAPRQPTPDYGAADPNSGVRELRSPVVLDNGGAFTLPPLTSMIKVMLTPGADRTFTLTIQNCSSAKTLVTSQGAMPIHLSPFAWALHAMPDALFASGAPASAGLERIAEDGMPALAGDELWATTGFHTPLSPGVFVVHRDPAPLFAPGEADRGEGLERIAEDGNPMMLGAIATGVFDTPIGASAPGPAMPGEAYDFEVTASPGDRLSIATMFGMSNDWFFAALPQGIALFDGDAPRSGDLTADIALYDAGTELDQEVAIGAYTAPQQPAPNTGPVDPVAQVRLVPASIYGIPVPTHLRVTTSPRN